MVLDSEAAGSTVRDYTDGIGSELVAGLGEAFRGAVAGSAEAPAHPAARLALLDGVR